MRGSERDREKGSRGQVSNTGAEREGEKRVQEDEERDGEGRDPSVPKERIQLTERERGESEGGDRERERGIPRCQRSGFN